MKKIQNCKSRSKSFKMDSLRSLIRVKQFRSIRTKIKRQKMAMTNTTNDYSLT